MKINDWVSLKEGFDEIYKLRGEAIEYERFPIEIREEIGTGGISHGSLRIR